MLFFHGGCLITSRVEQENLGAACGPLKFEVELSCNSGRMMQAVVQLWDANKSRILFSYWVVIMINFIFIFFPTMVKSLSLVRSLARVYFSRVCYNFMCFGTSSKDGSTVMHWIGIGASWGLGLYASYRLRKQW